MTCLCFLFLFLSRYLKSPKSYLLVGLSLFYIRLFTCLTGFGAVATGRDPLPVATAPSQRALSSGPEEGDFITCILVRYLRWKAVTLNRFDLLGPETLFSQTIGEMIRQPLTVAKVI